MNWKSDFRALLTKNRHAIFHFIPHPSSFILSAMPDFTGGAIQALPTTPRSIGDAEFDQRIRELVQYWGCGGSCDLIREMVVTALKMGRENLTVARLTLFIPA